MKSSHWHKIRSWLKARSTKEWAMIVAAVLLLVMIATRWSELTERVGSAFGKRFNPPQEQQN